jgi:hypothetical protein
MKYIKKYSLFENNSEDYKKFLIEMEKSLIHIDPSASASVQILYNNKKVIEDLYKKIREDRIPYALFIESFKSSIKKLNNLFSTIELTEFLNKEDSLKPIIDRIILAMALG